MDFKKILISWQSATLISLFFLSWSASNGYDNRLYWLIFIFAMIVLIPSAIKSGSEPENPLLHNQDYQLGARRGMLIGFLFGLFVYWFISNTIAIFDSPIFR